MSLDPMFDAAWRVFGDAVTHPIVDGMTVCGEVECQPGLVPVAFHEAGHAAARALLGLPFVDASVTYDPRDDTLGRVRFERWPDSGRCRIEASRYQARLPFRESALRPAMTTLRPHGAQIVVEQFALAALAGGWAERLVLPAQGFPTSGTDRRNARWLLARECLSVREARVYFRRLDRRAATFVRANERAITAVAYALLDRRVLTWRSVRHVVGWHTRREIVPSETGDGSTAAWGCQ